MPLVLLTEISRSLAHSRRFGLQFRVAYQLLNIPKPISPLRVVFAHQGRARLQATAATGSLHPFLKGIKRRA
jgi:hypothetical protein